LGPFFGTIKIFGYPKIAHLQRILNMNVLSGLYFPETGLAKGLFCSLLCLLDKVDFYQVVEKAEVGGGNDASPYWQGRVVLPLGDDRDRFLGMIRDVRAHAADYYSGYLAALSAGSLIDRDESSVWQLVANLHGANKESGQDPLLIEKLWQARLVLQLAEILRDEQAGLANALAELAQQEQTVFKAIKGELDDPDDDPDGVFQVEAPSPEVGQKGARAGHLLKAWGALFVMDTAKHTFLATDHEDGAAILFDAWEEMSGARPGLLVELAVPVAKSLEDMKASREKLAMARTAVVTALQDILAGVEVAGTAKLKRAAELWQSKAAEVAGRKSCIGIYLAPGGSSREVWGRVSGMPPPNVDEGRQSALIAVLGPPS
jgi:hypothetical protein